MARRRFIDPGFWTDTAVGRLSPLERLFFLGCLSNADEEGRLVASPAYLRSVIFPYDDFTVEEIRAVRDRVAAVCWNFLVYEVDGEEYIAFARWREYQSPRYAKPSGLPAPPAGGQAPAREEAPAVDPEGSGAPGRAAVESSRAGEAVSRQVPGILARW